ncbi:MAG: HAMP domain-containing histidine kinase [Flavobacteriales bacterium]|nr:HAMP domain-containing histidine kinase [Flavobacteriales bacterium]
MKNLSLRTRIYLSMIALILFSFIITGAITTFRFNKQNQDYHDNRLKRKERTVVETIRFLIEKNDASSEPQHINDLLTENVTQVAMITDLDINFFNFQGELLVSSHTKYFDEGIFVFQLSDSIKNELLSGQERVVMSHQADTLSILSTYRAISSSKAPDQKIAFMNIPYFQTDEQLNNDLQGFLKTLTQVYGLFFILAALFAYFISNYITKSLKTIGDKLKETSFEKKNVPVDWKSDDEIGQLVNEYNRMIGELENSANKLARSERDAAWREMAKQVAHEIKNPLTPMKLNLQYLQKSIDEKSPDWQEKFKRSSATLIEQIDTLSSIASAFSNFAQMPRSNMAEIDLKNIVENVTGLFEDTEHIDISLKVDASQDHKLNGDKDQLSRVVSNLLKNAIQAIPEENEGKVTVQLMKKGFQLILSVEDNGKGIPEEEFDKIFVPNFTTKSTGMGLGLAMVKNIVENHKGSVWFNSKVDEGTTFYISLPVNS